MPAVPLVTTPSVAPTPSSGLPYQNTAGATPDAFGASIGAAESGLGRGIEALSDVLEKHASKMQEDVNTSVAKDLFLKGDVEIGRLTTEYNSLEGANRVNAYPKYVEDIGKVRSDMKAEAPNDTVARKFDQDFARRVGYSIVDGARMAASANKQYQKDTNTAVRANALNHIAENAADDNRFQTELDIGKETFQNSDEYKGSSPEVRAQHDEAFVDSAWSTRLTSMAKNDPLRARELLKDAPVSGLTRVKLQDTVNQQIINVQSRVEADKIMQSGALVSPELVDKIKKLEGYRDTKYSDFKQTSIGYGTKYQPGDENIPPDQRKAVFEQRMLTELGRAANIVDTFSPGLPSGTRDALISLTYNAGSAWTSSGLGAKIRAGDFEGAKQNFSQYIQAGGQPNPALGTRRATELGWFGGEPSETGIDSDTRLAGALSKAREVALRTFPDDPGNQAKYMDTLQSRIKTDATVLRTAAGDMQIQLKNTVQAELVDPASTVTSYDKLSAKAQQAYDMASPALQQSFQKQMRANATRDVPYTPERQNLGDTLTGEAINEPDKFMARDITAEDLTRVQKSKFLKMQADRKALLDRGTKLSSAMASMQPLLNDASIGKSASDPTKNAEYNRFAGVYEQALTKFADEHKRPANDKEARDIGAGLLKDVVTSPGFLWDSKDRAYRVISDKTPITLRTENPNEHYASLPSGATFIGPDGKSRIKP